ncbi:MAG: hypothetical protein LBF84_04270 [Holosporales bacterium]|jgi:hypothetical protein|nr:hypothetical protein [Holosporales bacterium]
MLFLRLRAWYQRAGRIGLATAVLLFFVMCGAIAAPHSPRPLLCFLYLTSRSIYEVFTFCLPVVTFCYLTAFLISHFPCTVGGGDASKLHRYKALFSRAAWCGTFLTVGLFIDAFAEVAFWCANAGLISDYDDTDRTMYNASHSKRRIIAAIVAYLFGAYVLLPFIGIYCPNVANCAGKPPFWSLNVYQFAFKRTVFASLFVSLWFCLLQSPPIARLRNSFYVKKENAATPLGEIFVVSAFSLGIFTPEDLLHKGRNAVLSVRHYCEKCLTNVFVPAVFLFILGITVGALICTKIGTTASPAKQSDLICEIVK